MWRLLAVLLFAAPSAAAMEWLDADELEKSCDAYLAGSTHKDAALCLAFVQGFLAGAEASSTFSSSDSAPSGADSYADRAVRKRLGTLRMMRLREDQPDFCVDDSLSALHIVETVADYLRTHEDVRRLTNAEAVHEALVHEFPCEV